MIRVVLDTNLVVSGLLWSGSPFQVLQLGMANMIQIVTSEALVDELSEVIARPKFHNYLERKKTTPDAMVNQYLSYALLIQEVNVTSVSLRDIDDNIVLACAVGGQAKSIITGDKDLLVLKEFQGIEIVKALDFLYEF